MPSITVGPLSNFSTLQFSNAVAGTYAAQLAQAIANVINTGTNGGTPAFTQFLYPQGAVAGVAGQNPSGAGGVAAFQGSTTPQSVFVDGADPFIVVAGSQGTTPGPVSLQGGAAGGFFIGGAGVAGAARNITYTNITPTGTTATDTIVILGGNNLIQTATFGTGNYFVQTGDGNDTVNLLLGNGTINAGTGFNQINLGTGSSLVYSEGNDTITGVGFGSASGVDTISIGSGATSINSGGTSFLVGDNSPNETFVTLGSGVDSINVGVGAVGASVTGGYSSAFLTGIGSIFGQDGSGGDTIRVTGIGNATVSVMRGGSDRLDASGTLGANLLNSGAGNDTLIAGQGNDTITARKGPSIFQSGTGGSTTFSFTNGLATGGTDTISGFKTTDVLSFAGYGGNPISSTSGASGNVFSLTDGTTITFQNGVLPANGQIKIS